MEAMPLLRDALAVDYKVPDLFGVQIPSECSFGNGERRCTTSWLNDTEASYIVVHGGYLASLVHAASEQELFQKEAKIAQHDSLKMQIQFLRPVSPAALEAATCTKSIRKAVRAFHVALMQQGQECVTGYVK